MDRHKARARWRIAARVGALLAVVALAPGCREAEPPANEAPAMLEGRSLHLYDHLDQVEASGAVEALLAGPEGGEEWVLLDVDFEDGSWGGLAGFGGFGARAAAPRPLAEIVRGERAFRGGASVELRGDVPHGVSLRTPPIPVEAGRSYRLRYRVATEDVEAVRDAAFGGASLLLYRLAPDETERAAEVLADPERERERRLPRAPDFRVTRRAGTTPWALEEVTFTTGHQATHMVLSFDLSRPRDDRGQHDAVGTARYDEIHLLARRDPIPSRYQAVDDGAGTPHPLKVIAQLGHPARYYATEARYALAAPTPSALTFTVKIPEAGELSLGYGLLPEAQIPNAAAIAFTVEVRGAENVHQEVFRDELAPGSNRWFDANIDLAAFAGQPVRLVLRTEGAGGDAATTTTPGEALRQLPGAGAVWSYPILHARHDRARLLVLIGIDTLPAKRSSTYGYTRETSPALSAIAQRGVLFERALSPSPWTLPAFASMLTGLSPGRHRAGELVAREKGSWRPLAPGFVTVAERLRRAGWETRAWINNPMMTRAFGLQQGFSSYVDYASQGSDEAAEPGVTEVLAHLARPRGHDRFFFVHLMDPHAPYRSNDVFRSRFLSQDYRGRFEQPIDVRTFDTIVEGRELDEAERRRVTTFYEAAVAYTDWQVGRLFAALRDLAGSTEVSLIVSSDHGEEFWEHGLIEHGHTLYDELIRVPLVLWAPARVEEARKIRRPVSTEDVAATVLDLAGIEPPAGLTSRSLLTALESDGVSESRSFVAGSLLYGSQRLAVERDAVRYVYNQQANGEPEARAPRPAARHELYRLDRDPQEARNVFAEESERARFLHEELARHFVESLGGSYVIVLEGAPDSDGGWSSHRWEGTLTLPAGSLWDPAVGDLVWPHADGGEAPLRLARRGSQEGAAFHFQLEAARALLAFRAERGAGPLRLALSADGRPLSADRVALGGAGSPSGPLPAELEDSALRIEAQRLLAWQGWGPRVTIGRVDETPELRQDGHEAAPLDPELRRQLEALGYLAQ